MSGAKISSHVTKIEKNHIPDALSPQTLHATKPLFPEGEFEFESAADVVVAVTLDVGENGWLSAMRNNI